MSTLGARELTALLIFRMLGPLPLRESGPEEEENERLLGSLRISRESQ
jgi:hypothetical protein